MVSTLEGMLFDRMNEEAGDEIDLRHTGKKPGVMGRAFLGVAEVDSPVFQRFTQLFTQARDAAENNTFDDIREIQEKHEALKAWAKSSGRSLASKPTLSSEDRRTTSSSLNPINST